MITKNAELNRKWYQIKSVETMYHF